MKYPLLFLLSIFGLASSFNITGTWTMDWQSGSFPDYVNITEINSTALNLTYYPVGSTNMKNVTVIQNTTTTWTDPTNQSLVYYPSTNTLTYNFMYGDQGSVGGLYIQGVSPIPQDLFFAYLPGVWTNPVQANPGADYSKCCAPTSLLLSHDPQTSNSVDASYVFNSSNCSGPANSFTYGIGEPSPYILNWAGNSVTAKKSVQNWMYFSPLDTPTQLNLTMGSNGTCSYSYQRTYQTKFLSGAWKDDWQNLYNPPQISSYQVSIVKNLYMNSTLIDINNRTRYSIVSQLPGGQYFDPNFFPSVNFTYDKATDSLLFVGHSALWPNDMIFSKNGSLFSSAPFVSYWDNAQPTTGSDFSSSCCIPYAINITDDPSDSDSLIINYFISENFSSQKQCQQVIKGWATQINDTLSTRNPNLTQLFWEGQYGWQVNFVSPTNTSQIVVTDFVGQGGCAFTMDATSTFPPEPSPPKPVPLSAVWLSYKIIYVIIGLFMILV